MAIDTAAELLSILDGDPTTTPGMPFAHAPLRSQEQLHLLWLYSGLFDDAAAARTPTPAGSTVLPIQRWLVRTAPFDQLGEVEVQDLRLTIKRGIGNNTVEPVIKFRANRDNKGFGKTITRGLGKAGDKHSTVNIGPLGTAHVWQFEVFCDDDCDVELVGIEACLGKIGN